MQFVFFDTETTSTNATFGQMLEFSAIVCDESLNETRGSLSVQSRLRPHIIPELGALLVTNKTIEELKSRETSHYQMVMEVLKFSKSVTPSTWIGWNTIEFDFKWLRQAFYQCLHQPYFHQFYGNKRADALPIARTSHLVNKTLFKVPNNKKGKPSFKLEALAKANSIEHTEAHTALSDVGATIGVSKMILERCPEIWKLALQTTSKEETEELIWGHPLFIASESTFGTTKARVMTAVCQHPIYKWPMAMDLKICPSTYLTLNTEELKNAIRKSPKLLRTVQTGNHPIILPTDYKQQIPEYNKIEVNTLLERAKKIQRSSDLKEKIENILVNEVNEKRGRSFLNARLEEPEERLHEAYNSPSEADILTLNEFDSSKDWSKRYEIAQNLNDSRLRDLAFRLINEESPESLSPEINKRIDEEIKERLLGDIGSEWVTIKRAEESVTNHSSSKNSEREQEIIKSYKKFVEELKAKLNG